MIIYILNNYFLRVLNIRQLRYPFVIMPPRDRKGVSYLPGSATNRNLTFVLLFMVATWLMIKVIKFTKFDINFTE